jgi:peptidoglycan hydrolase-like protein with peptidoglycan-binding domain
MALQRALKHNGFDPGREDGRVDAKTMDAVRAFQQAKNLPVDASRYINIATVKALGVTP